MNDAELHAALAGILRVMDRHPDTIDDLAEIHDALSALVVQRASPLLPPRTQYVLDRFVDLWARTDGLGPLERRRAIMAHLPCAKSQFYKLRGLAIQWGRLT